MRAGGWAVSLTVIAGSFLVRPALARPALMRPALRSCSYEYRDDMRTFAHCAWIDAAGAAHLLPRHLARQAYDRHGVASLFVDRWYYVRRDGRSAPVMTFDNGPDDFADGLARSPLRGKVGFIDQRLRLVIPRRYDGAYPFTHGRAVICIGCRVESAGENETLLRGRWGQIDRQGKIITPLQERRSDGQQIGRTLSPFTFPGGGRSLVAAR